MEILEITQKVVDGKVVVELPKEFDNRDVKIIITADINEEDWAYLPAFKRIELLKNFAGKDKFPNIKVGKYDVYYQ